MVGPTTFRVYRLNRGPRSGIIVNQTDKGKTTVYLYDMKDFQRMKRSMQSGFRVTSPAGQPSQSRKIGWMRWWKLSASPNCHYAQVGIRREIESGVHLNLKMRLLSINFVGIVKKQHCFSCWLMQRYSRHKGDR